MCVFKFHMCGEGRPGIKAITVIVAYRTLMMDFSC